MRHVIIPLLIMLHLECSSQVAYDYVWCENVKVLNISSNKFVTICSLNEKALIEAYGMPSNTVQQEVPYNNSKYFFGSDYFIIPGSDGDGGESFTLKTNNFCLIVNDSIQIKVGESIESVLKMFPCSASKVSENDNATKSILLYNGEDKEPSKTEPNTSRIEITFLSSTNKIIRIYKFDLN